jgi:hypothetical protein
MTKSEYQELVEFLGVQFTAVGHRLDGIDGRLDGIEGRLTRVEVLAEENRHLIQAVAEGVSTVDRKVDALREEMLERLAEQKGMLELSHRDLDGRVTRLERKGSR